MQDFRTELDSFYTFYRYTSGTLCILSSNCGMIFFPDCSIGFDCGIIVSQHLSPWYCSNCIPSEFAKSNKFKYMLSTSLLKMSCLFMFLFTLFTVLCLFINFNLFLEWMFPKFFNTFWNKNKSLCSYYSFVIDFVVKFTIIEPFIKVIRIKNAYLLKK